MLCMLVKCSSSIKNAFTVENVGECYTVLPGVVSRKKQFLPAIVEALQQ